MGKVDFGGVTKAVCLEHVQDAQVGDYVLIHVGFALAKIDEEEAKRVFEFMEEMGELKEVCDLPEEIATPVPAGT